MHLRRYRHSIQFVAMAGKRTPPLRYKTVGRCESVANILSRAFKLLIGRVQVGVTEEQPCSLPSTTCHANDFEGSLFKLLTATESPLNTRKISCCLMLPSHAVAILAGFRTVHGQMNRVLLEHNTRPDGPLMPSSPQFSSYTEYTS